MVGHNGPFGEGQTWVSEQWTCGDSPCRYLDDFLQAINETQALKYRPILIFFEKKDWGTDLDDAYVNNVEWFNILEDTICDIFCCDVPDGQCSQGSVFGPDQLSATGWPTILDLAGHIIPYTSYSDSPFVFTVSELGLSAEFFDGCTQLDELLEFAAGGKNLLRADQYQTDWTFAPMSPVAPPNPLVVDVAAPSSTHVVNEVGAGGVCTGENGDDPTAFWVSEQGTFGFPFNTIGEATSLIDNQWHEWTILIRAGRYPEAITIRSSVTLEALGGSVTIGE